MLYNTVKSLENFFGGLLQPIFFLEQLSGLMAQISDEARALDRAVAQIPAGTMLDRAAYCRDVVLERMRALRAPVDEAELIADARAWPFPTYAEMLFSVQ